MTTIVWLTSDLVQAIHARQLKLFGGPPGLRDEGALESALGRPLNRAAYGGADLAELAAAYAFGIAKNHPFIDGNKRTGFVLGVLFLELNGYRFTATQEDAANAVLALAAGQIDEQGYATFLAANVSLSDA